MIEFYTEIIQKHIHPSLEVLEIKPIQGGCINNAQRLSTIKGDFFIKSNRDVTTDYFEKEALALELLHKENIITIPRVLGTGEIAQTPYLLLEYIHSKHNKPDYWKDFGIKLAMLHRVTYDQYGLEFDNYIGSLPQKNAFEKDWVTFFIEKRLKEQLKLGKSKKLITNELESKFDALFNKLADIIPPSRPSLIHGDLWSGNVMTDSTGFVCLMDPSCYYANREIEIAFTQLFGGFDEAFYTSYFSEFPVEKDYEKRAEIYNLYPLLVHVNMFGGSYLNAVNSILKRYT